MWMRNTTEEKKLFSMPIICKKKKSVDLQAYHSETVGDANLKNVQTIKYEKWKSMRSSLGQCSAYSSLFTLFVFVFHFHSSILVTQCFKAFEKSFLSSDATPFRHISCFGLQLTGSTESGRVACILLLLSQDRAAGSEGGCDAAAESVREQQGGRVLWADTRDA